MGFWGGLGKALGVVGGVAAAPFTGGASLIPTIAGIAGAAAPVIGGMAAGRAKGKEVEGDQALQKSALEQQLYDRAMQRYQTEAQMPTMRSRQALLGDLMANAQPGKTRFTTGMSNLTQGSRGAGQQLMEMARARMGNEQMPQLPGTPQMPNGGGVLDKILGIGGAASGLLGALPPDLFKKKPQYGAPGAGMLPGGPGSLRPPMG